MSKLKKFKYFYWSDPNMGWGVGETAIYIRAESIKDAKDILVKEHGFKHDPNFIEGDIIEVEEFIQPKMIPIIQKYE
jgi:hypothetical protein